MRGKHRQNEERGEIKVERKCDRERKREPETVDKEKSDT